MKQVTPLLISGGLDMSLVICPVASPSSVEKVIPLFSSPGHTIHSSVFEDAYYRRVPFGLAQAPVVQIAKDAKLLLCRNDEELQLYSISGSSPPRDSDGVLTFQTDEPELDATWRNVATLQLKTLTNFVTSAISDDGKWVAVSDYYECKLFRIGLNVGFLFTSGFLLF
jgi:U3 small nucleolar RNA-associated protein 4